MIWHDARHRRYFISKWLFLAALLPTVAFAQTHVKQPFTYKWDAVAGAERFELKLDNGAYVSVGLPPLALGTHTLPGDLALTGSHSAEVRACNVALGCSINTSTVAFVVDVPPPIPAAPINLRLVASAAPSPVVVEMLAPGIAPFWITDAAGGVWTMGQKDPAIEGGLQYVIVVNQGGYERIAGTYSAICYSGQRIYARSEPGAVWYQWTYDATVVPRGGTWTITTAPAGCV